MTIKLFSTDSEPNAVPKHLYNETELTGSVRDEVDVLRPTVRVELADSGTQYNYAYIQDFGRYYFIREITEVRTGIAEIQMEVDVLETYRQQYINCPMIAQRSDSHYNVYAPDPERQFYQYKSNQYITLGNVGRPNILVICTVG